MKMPNMMMTTFAVILVVGLAGFYLRGTNGIGRGDTSLTIGLAIGVPVLHPLQHDAKVTQLPVVMRLVNNTDAPVRLNADGPCKVFRYVVTTPDGDFIQALRRPDICTETGTESAIGQGEAIEEIHQVPLDTARYQPGDYQLRVKFWNYEATADFTLTK